MASQTNQQKGTPSTKHCTKCGNTKSVSEYHRNSASRDGLQHYCKGCARAWAAANRPRTRAAVDKWRFANPEKVAANDKRAIARRATRRARLAKVAQYFHGRVGWEMTVFRILNADSQRSGYCFFSRILEDLYLKFAEEPT